MNFHPKTARRPGLPGRCASRGGTSHLESMGTEERRGVTRPRVRLPPISFCSDPFLSSWGWDTRGPFLPAGRAASSPPSTTLAPRGHGARPALRGYTDRPGKEPLACTGALITQGLSQPASGLPLDFPQTSPTSPGTQGAARCRREPPRLSVWLLHHQASAWGGSPQPTTLGVPHIA